MRVDNKRGVYGEGGMWMVREYGGMVREYGWMVRWGKGGW